MIFFAINLSNVLRRPQENPKLLSVYFLEQILFYYSSIAFEFKSKEKISAFFREIIQLYQEYIPLQQYIDFAFVDEYYERMSFAVINKFYCEDVTETCGCTSLNYDLLDFLSKSNLNFLAYLHMYATLDHEGILRTALAHLPTKPSHSH